MSAHARAFSRIENPTLFFSRGGVRRAVPRVHEFTALRDCALLVLKNGVGYIYLIGTYDTFPEAEAAYAAFGAYAQNPFPLNHYGEYYNAYLRYPVLGNSLGTSGINTR